MIRNITMQNEKSELFEVFQKQKSEEDLKKCVIEKINDANSTDDVYNIVFEAWIPSEKFPTLDKSLRSILLEIKGEEPDKAKNMVKDALDPEKKESDEATKLVRYSILAVIVGIAALLISSGMIKPNPIPLTVLTTVLTVVVFIAVPAAIKLLDYMMQPAKNATTTETNLPVTRGNDYAAANSLQHNDQASSPRSDTNTRSNYSDLMTAISEKKGVNEVAKLITRENINTQDPILKNTPLHMAVLMNNPAIVELLLKNGAATDRKDHNDKTPQDLATNRNYDAIVKIFNAHTESTPFKP